MCLVLGCHCKRASSAQDVTFLLTHKRDPDHSACARGASNWDCRISEKTCYDQWPSIMFLKTSPQLYVSLCESCDSPACFLGVWFSVYAFLILVVGPYMLLQYSMRGSDISWGSMSDSLGSGLSKNDWKLWQPMVDMSPRRRHRRDVVTSTMAIVYRHCRWRISVLHVIHILYVFLNHLCFE